MISNIIKNICLISFALIAPVTLPAGGIQKNLNQSNKMPNNPKEIILNANTCLYSYPNIYSKELVVVNLGTSLSILSRWKINEKDSWIRVKLASNQLLDHPNKVTKGWIKM